MEVFYRCGAGSGNGPCPVGFFAPVPVPPPGRGSLVQVSGLGTVWHDPVVVTASGTLTNPGDRNYTLDNLPHYMIGLMYTGSAASPWPTAGVWTIEFVPPVKLYVWAAPTTDGALIDALSSELWVQESAKNFERDSVPLEVWSRSFLTETSYTVAVTGGGNIVCGVISQSLVEPSVSCTLPTAISSATDGQNGFTMLSNALAIATYTVSVPALGWSDPVTISNCGDSDADNVCAAGTMTKTEETGWNNRVWDERQCCWNCECTGVRWKVPMAGVYVYCGFSAFNAAGSTDKDGAQQMGSYFLEVLGTRAVSTQTNQLRFARGGPDAGWSETYVSPDTHNDQISFFEVHLTSTGADLVFGGTIIHTIDEAPADSAYRFGCATHDQSAGYSELAYGVTMSAPTPRDCTTSPPAVLSSGEMYDTDTAVWSSIAPMIAPRYAHAAAAVGLSVYVMGGTDGTAALDSAEVYNILTDSWSAIRPMPTARRNGAAGAVGTQIFVIGGSLSALVDAAPVLLDTYAVYNTASGAWSSTTALIPPNGDLFGGMDVVLLDAANAGQAVQWPSGGLTAVNGQSNQVFNFPKYIPGGASGGLGDPLSAWATDGATEPILSGDVVAFYHPATDQLFDCSGGSCNVQVFPLPAGHWGSSMRMYKLGGSVGDPILMCDSIYFDRMVNGAFDGGASLSATTSSIRGVGTMAARTVFTLAQTTTGSCELPPPAEPACLPAGSCVCEDGWQGDSCQFP